VILLVGAAVTLRRVRDLVADADDTARLAASLPLEALNEPAHLTAERMGDIEAVIRHPVILLRADRQRPWRDLRRRWSGRHRDTPEPS
jgi:hypothetical protein